MASSWTSAVLKVLQAADAASFTGCQQLAARNGILLVQADVDQDEAILEVAAVGNKHPSVVNVPVLEQVCGGSPCAWPE